MIEIKNARRRRKQERISLSSRRKFLECLTLPWAIHLLKFKEILRPLLKLIGSVSMRTAHLTPRLRSKMKEAHGRITQKRGMSRLQSLIQLRLTLKISSNLRKMKRIMISIQQKLIDL